MPREVRAYLLKAVRGEQTADAATLTRSDIYEVDGLVDLRGIAELSDCEVEGGLYPTYSANPLLDDGTSIFETLSSPAGWHCSSAAAPLRHLIC